MSDKEQFDIAVIIPLEEELIEFTSVFRSVRNLSTETRFQHEVESGGSGLKILVVQQDDMGRTSAASAASYVTSTFDIKLLVCLGIAGALSSDLGLCDVCYTGSIVDVYDNAKASDVRQGELEFSFSPCHYKTPRQLTTAINFVRTQPELKVIYEEWIKNRVSYIEKVLSPIIGGLDESIPKLGAPKTKSGTIACGAVSKSEIYNSNLKKLDRKILAIETESGGVFAVAEQNDVAVLTIRGISDNADAEKSQLEAKTQGIYRTIAANNAASFLRLQTENKYFRDAISLLRQFDQRELSLNQDETSSINIGDLLSEISSEIQAKLRELAPELRSLPTGYQLPTPRAQRRHTIKSIDLSSQQGPKEVKELIQRFNMIMINIPRNYPDQSLAWVIASDLLTEEVDQRQIVPIVIDGAAISPPRGTLDRISGRDLKKFEDLAGCSVVIIVDNCPVHSKTRLNHLLTQAGQFENFRFIFLSRGDGEAIFTSELASELSVELFDLSEVSFFELAYFVQKNFNLESSQADVVALRLRETFEKFKLVAHPTYFASIPSQILNTLINANKRSELIQLAVDGALSFLVAGDDADVALSRTTRMKYLRRLAGTINADGKNLNEQDLISFTNEFSNQFDYDIDAIAFIQDFKTQGILHIDKGTVKFSLPYIENYLLAMELVGDPTAARKYFNLTTEHFDYATFDLYAEIGAAESYTDFVVQQLAYCISEFSTDSKHAVFSAALSHSTAMNAARLDALRKRLSQAVEDVEAGKEDRLKKQRLLDARDSVQKQTASKTKERLAAQEKLGNEKLDFLIQTLRVWTIATLLLGSGSEHLSAFYKRSLCKQIVKLTVLILDYWTEIQVSIDFPEIRERLATKEWLSRLRMDSDQDISSVSDEEVKLLVLNIVDLFEYHYLTTPLARLLGHLCEQTRNRVLSKSLENIEVLDQLERIIHGSWLIDINPAAGRRPLVTALNEAPPADLMRQVLANHYISRAFWQHSDKTGQTALLEAAAAALKPTSTPLDKGKMKRILKASVKLSGD